jgi:hypothetical protein
MTTYDSPLGKQTTSSSKQFKEFDVSDESDFDSKFQKVPSKKQGGQYEVMDHQAILDFQARMDEVNRQEELENRKSNSNSQSISLEEEIRQAKLEKRSGIVRLSEGAKRRIEMLIGMTKTTHECNINGTTFLFRTLQAHDMRNAIMCIAKFDGTIEAPYEARKQFLARSIIQVANVEIDQFLGSSTLESKLLFIDEMDDYLLNRLYSEYLAMADEAKKKYSISKPEDIQELVNDLKK